MAHQHTPGFLKIVEDAKSRVHECTIDEMRARQARGEKFLLVDVREESEWTAGHIPGAIHLSKGIIERDIETKVPDLATPRWFSTAAAASAPQLAGDNLQKMGYTNVISMDGGMRGWWQEKALPEAKE